MIKRLKDIIFAITHPSFWYSNYPSHSTYDTYINSILDKKCEITKISNHTAYIDGKEFWISNYPYAFGNIYGVGILPFRRTRKRLFEYILESRLK